MDQNHIQEELTIIKNMIDKTRRETSESGNFFIAIGIYGIISTFAIAAMEEIFKLYNYILPALIGNIVLAAAVAYFFISRAEKKEKVKTYAKTVFIDTFFACGITAIMIMFLFPITKVYPFHLIPVLISLVFGITAFVSGSIFELQSLKWCSIAWWGGACLMAYAERGMLRAYIFMAIILFGWILPGLIMNRNYKNHKRSEENGS